MWFGGGGKRGGGLRACRAGGNISSPARLPALQGHVLVPRPERVWARSAPRNTQRRRNPRCGPVPLLLPPHNPAGMRVHSLVKLLPGEPGSFFLFCCRRGGCFEAVCVAQWGWGGGRRGSGFELCFFFLCFFFFHYFISLSPPPPTLPPPQLLLGRPAGGRGAGGAGPASLLWWQCGGRAPRGDASHSSSPRKAGQRRAPLVSFTPPRFI